MLGIELALKEAHKSTFKVQMGAVILKGGNIIAKGYNDIRYHALSSGYNWPTTLHAEAAALLKLHKKKKDAKGLTLYVARINRTSEQRFARPCPCCVETAKAFGIKKIVYTLSEAPWTETMHL